ncbi:hypothetical protein A2U01_0045977, partial [Trifolium medium]|nr:hypothetical protein [Trifolium medium]
KGVKVTLQGCDVEGGEVEEPVE